MRQLLFRLGRWLVLRNYFTVGQDPKDILMHDLRWQVSELRRENSALRTAAIVNRIRQGAA